MLPKIVARAAVPARSNTTAMLIRSHILRMETLPHFGLHVVDRTRARKMNHWPMQTRGCCEKEELASGRFERHRPENGRNHPRRGHDGPMGDTRNNKDGK